MKRRSLISVFMVWMVVGCGSPAPASVESLLTEEQVDIWRQYREESTFDRHLKSEMAGSLAVYNHLMDHPEVVSSCLRALGVPTFTIELTGDKLWDLDDARGATGTLELWAATAKRRLYYCDLTKKTRLGWTFRATVLFDVTLSDTPAGVVQDLTAHVSIHGAGEIVAQLGLPFVGPYFDQRLDEALGGARELTAQLDTDGAGTLRLLKQTKALDRAQAQALETSMVKSGKLGP